MKRARLARSGGHQASGYRRAGWTRMDRCAIQPPGHRRGVGSHPSWPMCPCMMRWTCGGTRWASHDAGARRAGVATRTISCARFEHQVDAARFSQAVGHRLSKFGLEVSADQTRVIPFSRHQAPGPTSFDVRGVEVRWGQDRTGKPHRKRRTSRQKRRNSLTQVTDWGQEQCRYRRQDVFRELNATLRGSYHAYGVKGNSARLRAFVTCARRLLCRWLTRRSQRRRYTWAGCRPRRHHFQVERPRIVGPPPVRRAAGRASAGLRPRVFRKSPARAHGTPGSVRGRSGDRPSYRDGDCLSRDLTHKGSACWVVDPS